MNQTQQPTDLIEENKTNSEGGQVLLKRPSGELAPFSESAVKNMSPFSTFS